MGVHGHNPRPVHQDQAQQQQRQIHTAHTFRLSDIRTFQELTLCWIQKLIDRLTDIEVSRIQHHCGIYLGAMKLELLTPLFHCGTIQRE